MQTIMGISCLGHDAAVSVIEGDRILFASHAERYSRKKNDPFLCEDMFDDCMKCVDKVDCIVYYESDLSKRFRQLYAGQWQTAFTAVRPKDYLRRFRALKGIPIVSTDHHLAHAAGGYFSSPFREAVVIVVDAIGEWNTISVWEARGSDLKKIATTNYPDSLGLFYSAFTHRLGFKPNEEEFIVMGLSAYGRPVYTDLIYKDLVKSSHPPHFRLRRSVHRGITDWRPELDTSTHADVAASVQLITEDFLLSLWKWAAEKTSMRNVVYSGGVALNCVANTKLARANIFDRIWIMPNPGDAGSSLGAALSYSRTHLKWPGLYLGHDIKREPDIDGLLKTLLEKGVAGLAHGKAEFGPRALGNRSLLGNPLLPDIKDVVNEIKKREPFRPFAPSVLEEDASAYFDLPESTASYMQYAVPCKNPDQFPGIVHVDGSSRVQTVNAAQNPFFYELIKRFKAQTGCPMLLNTSLNIKGLPIVNTLEDAQEFERMYHVNVF